ASGNDGGCGPGALSGPARWQSGGNVPLTARGCRVEILLVCHSDTRSTISAQWPASRSAVAIAASAGSSGSGSDPGHWAEIVDRDWRQVYSTDDLRRIYGGL